MWIDGERVRYVTRRPGLKNGVKAVAALYDMQHDPALREDDRLLENHVQINRISDHGVSPGVYLLDPDDNEIEVYYEMPASQWERHPEKGLFGGVFPQRLREPVVAADD